ncbi:hypothetical protein HOU25_gp47 [Corynebacterium phage Juicebox]|uniref:Uncharacterized protein n=1 Tax=Corynebacterium phage Juicebox TaxID=2301600 RepID=A0A385UEP2_9CAUD|nr:hypothetical protein HOU25_gp47 [Corynebacterium phage Juicebox]AYB69476.1 hypothetical protein JUICEBOX_47 [Corynebacterium phage Juicebox]
MNPQEAKDALARMSTWQGMSNDEAHDLLGEALEFIASMRTEYGVTYAVASEDPLGGPIEFDTGQWHESRDEARRDFGKVLEEDPEVVRLVGRHVSPLETMTTAVRGERS